MWTMIACYFLFLNGLSLYAMYADKQKAAKGEWRIPEANLLFFCVMGGFIGVFLGMKYFRHKTKHWQFHAAVIISALLWVIAVPFGGYWLLKS